MLAVPHLPAVRTHGAWRATVTSWTRFSGGLHLHGPGTSLGVEVERCAAGRLRAAYPAGVHDMELRVAPGIPGPCPADALRVLVDAVWEADPRCRRVVVATPHGDREAVAAMEAVGFRHVVDVDLGDEELGLLVAEPDRVTGGDGRLDRVPQS